MAAHLFNESGQMQEVDIPDIFDVLEGGEDEGAVKFLLGFTSEDGISQGEHMVITSNSSPHNYQTNNLLSSLSPGNSSSSDSAKGNDPYLTKEGKPRKRDPVDPSCCIYICDSCDKAFTTKFNLKRHINLHCNKSKEAGVPIQGPPSASMPSRKARERREAMAAVAMGYASLNNKKKMVKSIKSKGKSHKKKVEIPVITTTLSSKLATTTSAAQTTAQDQGQIQVQQAVSKGISHKPSVVTYQVGRPQNPVEVTSYKLNNSNNNTQYQSQQSVATPVRLVSPTHQENKVTRTQPVLPVQPLPESTIQMIQMVPQHQNQQQQFYQQRIVHVVQNPHQSQRQGQHSTIVGHIQSSNRTIPIIQQGGNHGMLQAIPVSLVPAAEKAMVTRSIQLPQQPLPVAHTLQASSQQKQLTTVHSSGQSTIVTSNISSAMPKYATTSHSTIHQRSTIQQSDIQLHPTTLSLSGTTITASIVSSSFLPTSSKTSNMRSHLDNELSCPPDDLFDSEDGDASSVATTTEAPSPTSMNGDDHLRGFTMISGDPDNFEDNIGMCHEEELDDDDDDDIDEDMVESSTVDVIVTSSTSNILEFAEYLEENEDADCSNASLNLPSNPPRGQLQEIPRGWLRKVITTGKVPGQQKVFYYNTMGKKFSSQEEIDQYFARLGQTVKPGLFNFEPPKLVDEDDDEDDLEEMESISQSLYSSGSNNSAALQQQQYHTLLT